MLRLKKICNYVKILTKSSIYAGVVNLTLILLIILNRCCAFFYTVLNLFKKMVCSGIIFQPTHAIGIHGSTP
jgi:hypothetical protein